MLKVELISPLVIYFIIVIAIGPTSLLALFWKRTTKTGVIFGLISGTVIVFIWKSIRILDNLLYELIPAFFIALAVTIVASLITSERQKK